MLPRVILAILHVSLSRASAGHSHEQTRGMPPRLTPRMPPRVARANGPRGTDPALRPLRVRDPGGAYPRCGPCWESARIAQHGAAELARRLRSAGRVQTPWCAPLHTQAGHIQTIRGASTVDSRVVLIP